VADTALLSQVFEAFPSPTLLVDDDVRVLMANRAARQLAGVEEVVGPPKKGGELMNCVHADEAPGGCGHAPACSSCGVRGSVGRALTEGSVSRHHAELDLKDGDRVLHLKVQVSASPIEHDGLKLAVLTIEDVSELVHLRSTLAARQG
jgi:PAS domain-containing protein